MYGRYLPESVVYISLIPRHMPRDEKIIAVTVCLVVTLCVIQPSALFILPIKRSMCVLNMFIVYIFKNGAIPA